MFYYQQENFNNSYDIRCRKHKDFFVPAHLHEFSEIMYVKKGVAEMSINGEEYKIFPNQLIYIPPNYIHEYKCRNTEVTCAVFSNDFIPLFFKNVGNKKIKCKAIDFADLSCFIDKIYINQKNDKVELCGYLNLIMAKVLQNCTLLSEEKTDNELFQKVIFYLSENYNQEISLKEVAKKFGYNEKYLSSTLHVLTGINFRELIALYRIQKAKDILLTYRDKPISEVATECGYEALNTFNRNFKRITGVTPKQYRG